MVRRDQALYHLSYRARSPLSSDYRLVGAFILGSFLNVEDEATVDCIDVAAATVDLSENVSDYIVNMEVWDSDRLLAQVPIEIAVPTSPR
ncbi:hypothetical protein COLO4_04442 [Corchorus olitorius]|uniref:Uncharacterized protein n=1 Tax=Corchorus olitorius TaxID=93759 RepID=A0A1R3KTY3_9ROSI|nr:hypothetical protein COLO4_04442 [Corchorus olitorius]